MASNSAGEAAERPHDTSGGVESSQHPQPQRTCIGCRGKGGRSVLLRIAVSPGTTAVVLDAKRTMHGRGAWLHADADCLSKAITRRAIGRALRMSTGVSTQELQSQMAEVLSTMSPRGDEQPVSHRATSKDHDRRRV